MNWPQENDEKLREMVAAKKTRREIAEHFGVNVAQIGGRVFRLGLTKPNGRRGLTKSRKDIAAV